MTKRNPYLQHTYESFDQPVAARRQPSDDRIADRIVSPGIAERLRNPLFATVAVLLTGAALAGIIAISYPDSKEPADNLPVVTADTTPFREVPSDPGGMEVAHQDSTIYNSIRSDELQETPPIENLLAAEEPADVGAAAPAAAIEPAAGETSPAPVAAATIEDAATPPSEMADATAETAESKIPKMEIGDVRTIPLKTEKIPPGVDPSAVEKPSLAPAASSPETLAYVRSVLDNKETNASNTEIASADAAAGIEPSAGAATSAGIAIKPGNYFVQLASISSESAAPKEWTKLQKTFSALGDANYRVQKADLAKGTFYRIQAGPMSKDSAKSVCESIKAQKPGGCIIVQ